MNKLNVLVVIPARGGSKGIPRKNLRSLAGKPLIYYSIKNALLSSFAPDVYVSSDDDEILSIAAQVGAKTLKRDATIAQDVTTLDPVIFDAYEQVKMMEHKEYDLVVTLQPTSPLLKSASLDEALQRMVKDKTVDTIISAQDDTHLTWKKSDDRFLPNYEKRLNRQYLTPVFKETGGFLVTRPQWMCADNRIGKKVELFLLEGGENIDIDTYEDWHLCEYYLKRKRILFVVSGYSKIGLGHVYNTLLIANDILNHSIEFLVDKKSAMAYEKIQKNHYVVHMQQEDDILDDIKKLSPDLVINDRLNTDENYMLGLREMGVKIVNFEDNGNAKKYADIVINAIYPEEENIPKHYYGYQYFLLRDEFLLLPKKEVADSVKNVLLTFGGTDMHNYTCKVIAAIYDYCRQKSIKITVVAGFGYKDYDSLEVFKEIEVYKNAKNIAEHMYKADIIFTSAGRTTYEIAALQIPAIVLAQNERELTHEYASELYGFNNLGLGYELGKEDILNAFISCVEDVSIRKKQHRLMSQLDVRSGRKKVLALINSVMEKI